MSHAEDVQAMKMRMRAKARANEPPSFDLDPDPPPLPTVRRRSDPLPPDLERARARWQVMKDAARRAWLWSADLREQTFALREHMGKLDAALSTINDGYTYVRDERQVARTQLEAERASIVAAIQALNEQRTAAAALQRERSVLLERGKAWLVERGVPAELIGDSNVAGHAPARETTIIAIR